MTTWIRVEDEFCQFDHPKGAPLPKGVRKIKGYPEHTGRWARDPKRRTSKGRTSAATARTEQPESGDEISASEQITGHPTNPQGRADRHPRRAS